MNVVLLRVGIDLGCGGALGPLFADGRFEFVPIPDITGTDARSYGGTMGRHGRALVQYLPDGRHRRMADQPMHCDPEFTTFTYGDPSALKSGLARLRPGDLLAFYAGLRGWDHDSAPALYLIGYFDVALAGRAADLPEAVVRAEFGENFHVRHQAIYAAQRQRLVLVKGGPGSRLLSRAYRISVDGVDRRGRRLHVLAPPLRDLFGDFGGRLSFQRSPPRRVAAEYVKGAAAFLRTLE
jgi:hypothetical protein